ncbi:MAG: hypothetical protein ABI365_00540 [Lysobacteraceae bacterium]
MQAPNRRSSSAVSVTLIACGIGWFVLPYMPGLMPGEWPGRIGQLQLMFTWWPLALLAAFVIGLALPHVSERSVLRGILLVLQWLLTFASVMLIAVTLFEVFFPRPF